MNQLLQTLGRFWWLLLVAVIGGLLWFLPINGTVLVSSLSLDPDAEFPQYNFSPAAPQPRDAVFVTISDNVPWTHVKLTANGSDATFVSTQALPLRQLWSWTWRVSLADVAKLSPPGSAGTELAFYRDCESGCTLRDKRLLDPYIEASQQLPAETGTPTKLCVAFPDPDREWHGRSGWVVDLTYADTEAEYWQIDALSQRVQQSAQKGLRVLVRVDYTPKQSIPHEGKGAEVRAYLEYIQLLARDDRLRDVHAYIIGSGFNTVENNSMTVTAMTTAKWYASLFNGLGKSTDDQSNDYRSVVQTVRAHNSTVRVLVGPVRPWNSNQDGIEPFTIDAPWLNYMNEVVDRIDQNTREASARGIPLNGPDGFALNVPGRPYALNADPDELDADPDELRAAQVDPALEPTLNVVLPDYSSADPSPQGGFQIYRDWLSVINNHPTTRGKPAYITSTNTFGYDSSDERSNPAQGYPSGWLTNALEVINQEPQIESLCWFLDLIPNDQRWADFSLAIGKEQMAVAAQEFDQLLQE